MIPFWASKYVGTPFTQCGFDARGVHCWGLVWWVMKDEKNIVLSRHGDVSAGDFDNIGAAVKSELSVGDWLNVVGERREFDIVLMHAFAQRQRCPLHVGILINPDRVMHVEQDRVTSIVRLSQLSRRVVSVHRHRLLAS